MVSVAAWVVSMVMLLVSEPLRNGFNAEVEVGGYSTTIYSLALAWWEEAMHLARMITLWSSVAVVTFLVSPSGAQTLFRELEYRCNDALYINNQRVVGYSGRVEVAQWRNLANERFRTEVAAAVLKDLTNQCLYQKGIRASAVEIFFTSVGLREGGLILSTPQIVLKGWSSAEDHQWHFLGDNISQQISQEDEGLKRLREAQQKEIEMEAQRKTEAEAKEKRRVAALADCGASPSISGGPWFSSTYKTAATDAARNQRFLCMKTVEYIGAAVNPFGGNAARAKFAGYDAFNYQPLTVVMDFPY